MLKRKYVRSKEVEAGHNAVGHARRAGKIKSASCYTCFDCGAPATDYDHYLGYAREHLLDIQPVCRSCHTKREIARGKRKAICESGALCEICNALTSLNGECNRCYNLIQRFKAKGYTIIPPKCSKSDAEKGL